MALLIGLGVEALGVVFWFAWKSRTPPVEELEEQTPTAVAEYRSSGEKYQVVVPIANPRNLPQLMRTAMTLAEDNDGEILVMSVVTVPDQSPLSRGREQTGEKRAVLDQAMDLAEDRDIPVSGTIRIGHNAADAILNTITQHDSDAVIVGWKGRRSKRRDIVLGTNVDRVVREADCDVFVEKFGMGADGEVDSILVPGVGGPHAELAVETAGAIARHTGATVHAVYVIDPNTAQDARQRGDSMLADRTAPLEEVTVETTLLESADVVSTLVEESATHDLTIIGATREGVIQKFVFGTIPETVAERAPTTVIMTKRSLDVRSRLRVSLDKLRERVSGSGNAMEQNRTESDGRD